MPLVPDEVVAVLANNINDMNEAAGPQAEQDGDDIVEIVPDVGARVDDEAQLEGDNDENDPGDPNESDKDSDGDEDGAQDRDVPQSPAIQPAENNPIARISNNHPGYFETLNQLQPEITNRV